MCLPPQPKINEDPKDAMLREFQEEISRLKAMLEVGPAVRRPGHAITVPVLRAQHHNLACMQVQRPARQGQLQLGATLLTGSRDGAAVLR